MYDTKLRREIPVLAPLSSCCSGHRHCSLCTASMLQVCNVAWVHVCDQAGYVCRSEIRRMLIGRELVKDDT